MTELSRRASQVLAQARAQRPKLDHRRRARVRTAVVMSLATAASTAQGAEALGATKPLGGWLTTTIGKVVVGLGAAIVGSSVTAGVMMTRRALTHQAVVVAKTTPRHQALAVKSFVPTPPAAVIPAPVLVSDVETETLVDVDSPALSAQPVAPVAASEPVPSRVVLRHAAPSAVVERSTSPEVVEVGPSNRIPAIDVAKPLRDELTVLRLAMTHHDSGNDGMALANLDEYAERFPNGVLLLEAQVLRVLVLCQLGRATDAKTMLRELERSNVESPAILRLKTSCAAE
jgi:hypothetical protein